MTKYWQPIVSFLSNLRHGYLKKTHIFWNLKWSLKNEGVEKPIISSNPDTRVSIFEIKGSPKPWPKIDRVYLYNIIYLF
jgi:hypothetical protein